MINAWIVSPFEFEYLHGHKPRICRIGWLWDWRASCGYDHRRQESNGGFVSWENTSRCGCDVRESSFGAALHLPLLNQDFRRWLLVSTSVRASVE